MSIVQKAYFTVASDVFSIFEHELPPRIKDLPVENIDTQWDDDNDWLDSPDDNALMNGNKLRARHVAAANLPFWFSNANPKFKKIIRVLGATAHFLDPDEPVMQNEQDLDGGWRMFSNISEDNSLLMRTRLYPEANVKVGKAGFVMVLNNYNSQKEFDISGKGINVVKFYIRPWDWQTTYKMVIDFVGECELLLVDEER
ncbi:hypothetical protein FACS189472_15020 [Alphaproteobacteria bacterium]|nr:hypothetical protein FACS189472_15020 [Alphaproteobacteria bacterium]